VGGGGGKYGRKSPKPSTIMQVRNDFFSRRNPSNVQSKVRFFFIEKLEKKVRYSKKMA
jgi:hypothetical protein